MKEILFNQYLLKNKEFLTKKYHNMIIILKNCKLLFTKANQYNKNHNKKSIK